MRQALPCDCPMLAIDPDEWGSTAQSRELVNTAVALWRSHGSRIVILGMDAAAELNTVPMVESLSVPALSDEPKAVFVTVEVPPGHTALGVYCFPTADEPGLVGARIGSNMPIDAVSSLPVEERPGQRGVQVFLAPPLTMRLNSESTPPDGAPTFLAIRVSLAAYAAVHDPLWVRRILPGWGVSTTVPFAPRRARKRGDPRAEPYKTVRLTPDAKHIVRRRGAPIRLDSAARPPSNRRAGRGIRLGEPIAEHDVRGHHRRLNRPKEWADERHLQWIDGFAIVPVRPHTRGKGRRKPMLVRKTMHDD